MNRIFDPIDIFFIVLISIYIITLFLIISFLIIKLFEKGDTKVDETKDIKKKNIEAEIKNNNDKHIKNIEKQLVRKKTIKESREEIKMAKEKQTNKPKITSTKPKEKNNTTNTKKTTKKSTSKKTTSKNKTNTTKKKTTTTKKSKK